MLANYEFGLRSWQLTVWFFVSIVAAYVGFSVFELFWHAALVGMRIQWGTIKERLISETSEALARTLADEIKPIPIPKARTLDERQKDGLIRALKVRKGHVQILSRPGDPEAFKYGLQLAAAFKDGGWLATQSLANLPHEYGFSGLVILYRGKPNQDVSAVSHALLGADIAYQFRGVEVEMPGIEHDQCTLFVGEYDI